MRVHHTGRHTGRLAMPAAGRHPAREGSAAGGILLALLLSALVWAGLGWVLL